MQHGSHEEYRVHYIPTCWLEFCILIHIKTNNRHNKEMGMKAGHHRTACSFQIVESH